MPELIKFNNVSKNIGNKKIVENLSFGINKGTITTIIGPNGAGKTTLAKILAGIIPHSSGDIEKQKGLTYGYIPQKLHLNEFLPLDVKSFFNIFLFKQKTSEQEVLSRLREVKLNVSFSDSLHNLSGGQLQKLFIALNLLIMPDILILDEAVSALDVNSRQEFYNIILEIKNKITIIMISHDLHYVMSKSDNVICMNKHICCQGSPLHIASTPEFKDMFKNNLITPFIHNQNHDHRHDHRHDHEHKHSN